MSIYFQNNTELPIVVETWIKVTNDLSRLIDICILPNETTEIKSLTGEWKIHRMFSETENSELWNEFTKINKNIPLYLGKFRNQKAVNDEHIWMDTDLFCLTEKENIFVWSMI